MKFYNTSGLAVNQKLQGFHKNKGELVLIYYKNMIEEYNDIPIQNAHMMCDIIVKNIYFV